MDTQIDDPAASPEKQRHLALLITLLAMFTLSPFILTHRLGVVFLNVAGAAVLFSGTYAVSERKSLFVITIFLAILSVATEMLLLIVLRDWLIWIAQFSVLLLLVLFSVNILRNVLRAGRVTADKIYGAICVYLLVAYAWALAYSLVEMSEPGSFNGLTGKDVADHIARVMQLRYFSFTTMTTVGFGDITPQSPVARTFAMLEAVMGQMYLAVLVARLVGLHIVHASQHGKGRIEELEDRR